jgi:hypothetical protein
MFRPGHRRLGSMILGNLIVLYQQVLIVLPKPEKRLEIVYCLRSCADAAPLEERPSDMLIFHMTYIYSRYFHCRERNV